MWAHEVNSRGEAVHRSMGREENLTDGPKRLNNRNDTTKIKSEENFKNLVNKTYLDAAVTPVTNHTAPEIKAKRLKAINNRLTTDRITNTRIKRNENVTRPIDAMWRHAQGKEFHTRNGHIPRLGPAPTGHAR